MSHLIDVSPARLKRAQVTSAVGAGVLGAGLALLLGELLRPHTLPLLLLGLLIHSWGMYDLHRLEADGAARRTRWTEVLYRVCWVLLLGLAAYVVVTKL